MFTPSSQQYSSIPAELAVSVLGKATLVSPGAQSLTPPVHIDSNVNTFVTATTTLYIYIKKNHKKPPMTIQTLWAASICLQYRAVYKWASGGGRANGSRSKWHL